MKKMQDNINEMDLISRFKMSAPVKIRELIGQLGVRYIESRLPDGQSGYFAKTNGSYEIGVNNQESRQRMRFTAAHELGHYVLHRDLLAEGQHFDRLFGADAKYNESYPFTNSHEAQANRFAADLLMPASLTRVVYSRNRDLHEVSRTFEVSDAAAVIRLSNLGLMNDQ